jgi:hypothetical protein
MDYGEILSTVPENNTEITRNISTFNSHSCVLTIQNVFKNLNERKKDRCIIRIILTV